MLLDYTIFSKIKLNGPTDMHIIARILRKCICSGLLANCKIFPVTGKAQKTIYLTFDDGPHPTYTDQVLDMLRRHQVVATFFVNGNKLLESPQIAARITRHGHLLGNHTYSHQVFTEISKSERRKEVILGQTAVDGFQRCAPIFRPPQGLLNFSDFNWLIRHGHTIVMWSIDSHDSFHLPVPDIQRRLKHLVKGSNVLLFHDDDSLCIQVLETLIPWWQSQGFSFSVIN